MSAVYPLSRLYHSHVVTPCVCHQLSLADRWQQMSDLSYRSHVISLDTERFKSLVRAGPRNYSTIVMFTAMDARRGCAICR